MRAPAGVLARTLPLDVAPALLHPPTPMRRALASVPLLLLLPACSGTPTGLEIDITAGQDQSTWSGITSVAVDVASLDGTVHLSAALTDVNGGTFDFGNVDSTAQITVTVQGVGAGGKQVMAGSSLSGLQMSAIQGASLPVFVGTIGQWARPPGSYVDGTEPGGIARSHVNGVAAVDAGRYVLLVGGKPATEDTASAALGVDGYDVFALGGVASSVAYNPVPETILSLSSELVLVTESSLSLIDTSGNDDSNTIDTPPLPLKSFDQVAGGQGIASSDGRHFVVGGTRLASGTRGVLQLVDGDLTLTSFQAITARQGAAAVWIDGTGLAVAGGSASGAGVEVLSTTTGSVFEATGFASDATRGAAAMVNGAAGQFLLVGGVQPDGSPGLTRVVDLNDCTTACKPTILAAATLPRAIEGAVGFKRSDGTFLVIGNEVGTGETLSFVVDVTRPPPSVTPVPFRERRFGAAAIDAPNATIAVLGGEDASGKGVLSVEMLYP